MSVRTMARVWEHSQHGGTDLLALLAIADFADDDGNAYPSVGTLAMKCRLKPRRMNYILAELSRSGELAVHPGGPRGTNRYRITLNAAGVQPSAGVHSNAGVQPSASPPCTPVREPLHPSADKPSIPTKEPSKKKSASPIFVLPDWIPDDAWNGYVEMRTKIRSSMTTRAMELKVTELERLKDLGHDVGAILDKSTSNNWKDVYPLKTEGGARPESKPWEGAR